VRICGQQAVSVADKVFTGDVSSFDSHKAHLGRVVDGERLIDEALLLPMLGTRSFTGEDTVEIQCHGGTLVARQVLEAVIRAGARPAGPGEFTFRAFMNGRMDLAQAEAVAQLIHARNTFATESASDQLVGRLSRKIGEFQAELTEIAALFEAWVDFPEEGLEFATEEEVNSRLTRLVEEMERLVTTFHDGRIVQEGLSLCIVGRPNVGKSSLMNALLERDRAIVTPIAGTTRDLLEDGLMLGGLHLRLIDTAGIRDSVDAIEQEGIRRSHLAMEEADLVLIVLDSSKPLREEDRRLLAQGGKSVAIWNKIDLGQGGIEELTIPSARVSAKEGRGLEQLKEEIDRAVWKGGAPARDQLLITQVRHKEALERAITATKEVIGCKRSPEFLSLDVRAALVALGEIIGTDVTEEILSAIFRRFCIGK